MSDSINVSEHKILNDRIIELESKLAFQEHTIQELNEVVTSQQTELMIFKKQLIKISNQLENQPSSIIADASQETPPPHY
ncbi:MAG: SlyX family protein [Gammaproteobacteria bacterium]|nr:SlyX family protein [Gammaproteobacteria bacterium]